MRWGGETGRAETEAETEWSHEEGVERRTEMRGAAQ